MNLNIRWHKANLILSFSMTLLIITNFFRVNLTLIKKKVGLERRTLYHYIKEYCKKSLTKHHFQHKNSLCILGPSNYGAKPTLL